MKTFDLRTTPLPPVAISCLFLLVLTGCGSGYALHPPGSIVLNSATSVSLYPLENEDLDGPCTFDLLLQEPDVVQAGTLVVYERGDSRTLYNDATLQSTALALHYSMVWAHECDAASTGAFQADASKGPARILFAAMTQFATNTSRPELATGGVVLYGFSAAGVLTATMSNQQPDRLLAAVEYAAGDAHVDLELVPVSAAAARIPTLVLTNADDIQAGTYRGLNYFTRAREQSALWAYGVQNATGHCCTLSTEKILVPFLQAIAAAQAGGTVGAPSTQFPRSMFASFTCILNGVVDAQGYTDCKIGTAGVSSTLPSGPYGWLPDRTSANAWLSWVLNATTN